MTTTILDKKLAHKETLPFSAIRDAIQRDDVKTVKSLVDSSRVNKHFPDGETPLGLALQKSSIPMIQTLLDMGANANGVSLNTQHAHLVASILLKRIDLVRLLLAHGADPNIRHYELKKGLSVLPLFYWGMDSVTPLHVAVFHNCSVDIVRALLENNAGINDLILPGGEMALDFVEDDEVAALLVSRGAKVTDNALVNGPERLQRHAILFASPTMGTCLRDHYRTSPSYESAVELAERIVDLLPQSDDLWAATNEVIQV